MPSSPDSLLSPARNTAANTAPNTVRTATAATVRKAPESALDLVPEARGRLRGLAANPAAPESVRDRLRAAGRAADAPPALTLAGLADAVRGTPDAAVLRVRHRHLRTPRRPGRGRAAEMHRPTRRPYRGPSGHRGGKPSPGPRRPSGPR
ncbi:hypothetical protein ACU686_05445 [Yinghuangia aomiensis]